MSFDSKKWFTYLFLFFNSQMLFQMGANPIGIRGVQEIFLFFVFIYSIAYIADKAIKKKLHYLDLYIFVLVIALVSLSSLFAFLKYEQPIVYGVIEARITFAMFVYFPIRTMLASSKNDPLTFLKIVLNITLFIVFFALLIKLNILPKSLLATSIDSGEGLRADRNSMGRFYMILSFLFTIVMYVRTNRKSWILILALLAYSIFFILQEKQAMLGLIIATSLYLSYRLIKKGDLKLFLAFSALIGSSLITFTIFFPMLLNDIITLLSSVSVSKFVETTRYRELFIIFREMKLDYGLLGHGSVWASWNGGFSRIYGELFHLGDVGIFGTVFRLGLIFFIPIFISTIMVFYKVVKKMESSIEKDVVILGLLYSIVTSPTSAPIEYRGYFIGLILAIAVSKRRKLLQ